MFEMIKMFTYRGGLKHRAPRLTLWQLGQNGDRKVIRICMKHLGQIDIERKHNKTPVGRFRGMGMTFHGHILFKMYK